MDLRLTPDLIEIRERSRRFCDEWLIPFEQETEEAGSLSMDSYGAHPPGRARRAPERHEHAASNGAGRASRSCSRWSPWSSSDGSPTRSGTCVWRPAKCSRTAPRRSASASSSPSAAASAATPTRSPSPTPARTSRGSRPPRDATAAAGVINGEKWFVTVGDIADYLIVLAEADGHGADACSSSTWTRPACASTRRPRYMHTFVYEHPEFIFEDVFVGPTTRCSAVSGRARTDQGLVHRGAADDRRAQHRRRRARARAGPRTRRSEREQFGGADRGQPGHRVPRSPTAPSRSPPTRALTYQVAWEFDHGRSTARRCTPRPRTVKLAACEMAGRVVDRCVQIFGGRGYMRENPCRAPLPRPAGRPHLGGHQRDPAHGHRQRAAQARPGRHHGLAGVTGDAAVGRAGAARAAHLGCRARDRAQRL